MTRPTNRPITKETLGTWVLSCDPAVWDLEAFVADGHRVIGSWSVRPSYRTDLMQAGQRVLLWVSGSSRRYPRGFWGSGWVTGEATQVVEDDGYWIDEERRRAVGLQVPVALTVFEDGFEVPAAEIREHPVLRDFELFRAVQMSNPSWVSVEQLAALDSVPWPPYPGAAEDVVVVGEGGAARGDAATRRAIELAAMATVQAHYERRGGSVKDVSAACVGYDLECTDADGRVEHVEVKGVGGWRPAILLTRNEHRVAGVDPAWRLAVVVHALEPARRGLTFHEPDEVLGHARPYVFEVDLSTS